ncbi:hypothetical protein GCM10008013_11650 [Paenibacillus segetis]|uniref:Uncharacterized protein n=2 Tax=Paenibacillus segetis TaxID=1325360 RepID=A0ABQ1Y9A0_9BACL|nr:hypothetical protein GCM10008013_11650 [Paenibacillus segetis]
MGESIYIEQDREGYQITIQDITFLANATQIVVIKNMFGEFALQVRHEIESKSSKEYNQCYIRWIQLQGDEFIVGFGGTYSNGKSTEGKMGLTPLGDLTRKLRDVVLCSYE